MEALDIELEPTARSVTEARHAVTQCFRRLPSPVLDDLRLLVSELVANGVLHGQLQPHDSLRLRVAYADGTVRGEVRDPGYNGPPCPKPVDPETPGGFGLHLVERLSDRWGVERAADTRVWFELAA